jgi:hypothetical protein
MGSSNSNKASLIAAWAALALLVLLPTAPAWASEAANVFGGAAQSATQAAKPVKGAGKVSSQPAKQSATGAKSAHQTPKVSTKVASTPAATTTTATTATQESSSGTNTAQVAALALGVLLLGGVAFVIVRDARSVAPVVEGATGGTRNPEGRLRKRRAQAKAARQQRKRHRKR